MLVAIDPDVLVASVHEDYMCEAALLGIVQNLGEHRFAVDNAEIEAEYYEFFGSYCNSKVGHPAITILECLINNSLSVGVPIPNHRSPSLETEIMARKCTTQVEPELLGMVENAKDTGLKLLLVGDCSARKPVRHRGLCDPAIKHQIWKALPWLDVAFASETPVPSPFSEQPEHEVQTRIFELLVPQSLQEITPMLRCVPKPSLIPDQIDVYGYVSEKDVLTIVVGECKLQKEGNENKLMPTKYVGQLRREVEAARQYETRPDRKGKSREIRVRGLLISNSYGLEEDALELLKEYQLEYWRASLPTHWSSKLVWNIQRLECLCS